MPGYVTKLLIFLLDSLFGVFSFYCTIFIISGFTPDALLNYNLLTAGTLLIAFRILGYFIFKTYLIIIRYIGEKDYRSVFYAVTFSTTIFLIAYVLFPSILQIENALGVILVDYLLLLCLVGGIRILMRIIFDQQRQQITSRLNTVIFGAGELGAMLDRVLKHNVSHTYKVVAFFDDNPRVHKKYLNGIPIFNPSKSFDTIVEKHDVKVAIIGINVLPEKRRISFINQCLRHRIKVLKVPPTEHWLSDRLNIGQLKNINFEDLLNRAPIYLGKESIKHFLNGKRILVTGCAGSIGSEILRQLLHFRPEVVIGFDQAETPLAEVTLELKKGVENKQFLPIIGDVRNYQKLERVFEQYKPDYVFHAAAYKHVPIMEAFPEEAVEVNVEGTKNLADLSVKYEVEKFVMISTDKVVNPANIMGASKRIAEIYVQSLNYAHSNAKTQFITTRFGNVLGSNGSVIPIFKAQIEKRLPITVTHPEVTRFFMTIPEACQLVLEAGGMGNGGEIFVFDMGEPVLIADLAKKMAQLAGLTPGEDIEIIYTGLRPGEKLTEELLDDQEGLISTHHPKIKKAQVRIFEHLEVKSKVLTLISTARGNQPIEDLVLQMKEIVPEFNSQNSVFSSLDHKIQTSKT